MGNKRKIGLFRRNGGSLGLVHDSLAYYFTGKLALRDHLGPGDPSFGAGLNPDWSRKVAERVRDHPARWKLTGEFVGAALRPSELRDLSKELLASSTPTAMR
jgi:hypothetical protein